MSTTPFLLLQRADPAVAGHPRKGLQLEPPHPLLREACSTWKYLIKRSSKSLSFSISIQCILPYYPALPEQHQSCSRLWKVYLPNNTLSGNQISAKSGDNVISRKLHKMNRLHCSQIPFISLLFHATFPLLTHSHQNPLLCL